jgi:hypothetical protein
MIGSPALLFLDLVHSGCQVHDNLQILFYQVPRREKVTKSATLKMASQRPRKSQVKAQETDDEDAEQSSEDLGRDFLKHARDIMAAVYSNLKLHISYVC